MAQSTTASPKVATLKDDTRVRTPLADAWFQFRKNRLAVISLIFLIGLITLAVTAPILSQIGLIDEPGFKHQNVGEYPLPPLTCSQDPRRQNPQWCFVLGSTYRSGHDLLTRTIYGTRLSLLVGVVGVTTSMLIGTLYGMVAGYYGGRTDNVLMRVVDFFYALPGLPLIIVLQTLFNNLSAYKDDYGPFVRSLIELDRNMGGLLFLFFVIGLLSWLGVARLARALVLSNKNREYIEAARAMGARNFRIMFIHLLPNIAGPLIVVALISVPGFITTEVTLTYLGIGVAPGTPSWGSLIQDAQTFGFTSAQQLFLVPGVFFGLTSLAFNYLGDGLRDAFDPSLRGN
jgi:oligopeptide transport system permease protein